MVNNNLLFRNICTDKKEFMLPKDKDVTLRVSSYSLVFNKGGEVLLVKDNFWQFPGGGIEIDETITECCERETLEESGYEVKVFDEKPIWIGYDYFKCFNTENYYQSILMVFKADLLDEIQTKLKLDFKEEIIEVKWFSLKELENLENIREVHKEIIKNIKLYLK